MQPQNKQSGHDSHTNTSSSDRTFSRRGTLKRLGAGSIGLLSTTALFTQSVSADSSHYDSSFYDSWIGSDSMKADYFACPNYGGRRILGSTSVLYWGSIPIGSSEWIHRFSASTHAQCQDRDCRDNAWKPITTLDRIKYTFRSRNNSGSYVTNPFPDDLGADPAPNGGQNRNYNDTIYTALAELAGEVSKRFGYVISAYDIIRSLTDDRPNRSGSEVIYDWYYGGSTDRAETSYYFEVHSPKKYIDFDFEGLVREQEYNSHAAESWIIRGFAIDDSSVTQSDSSTENETDIQQRRPDQPVNVTRTAATKPRKVYLDNMSDEQRARWEPRIDKSHITIQALPLEVKKYTYSGGPDVVKSQ